VRYQRIIPLLAAELWKAGIDTDTWNLQQALALSKPGNLLYQSMKNWDSQLKLRAINNRTGIKGSDSGLITDRVSDPGGLLS